MDFSKAVSDTTESGDCSLVPNPSTPTALFQDPSPALTLFSEPAPADPSQNLSLSTAPAQNSSLPVSPFQIPSLPASPAQYPSLSTAPTQNPSLPVSPTQIPSIPVSPAQIPSLPVSPAHIPSLPVAPAHLPSLPVAPARNPSLPAALAPNPSFPAAPTQIPFFLAARAQIPSLSATRGHDLSSRRPSFGSISLSRSRPGSRSPAPPAQDPARPVTPNPLVGEILPQRQGFVITFPNNHIVRTRASSIRVYGAHHVSFDDDSPLPLCFPCEVFFHGAGRVVVGNGGVITVPHRQLPYHAPSGCVITVSSGHGIEFA